MSQQTLPEQFPFDATQPIYGALKNLMVVLEGRFAALEAQRASFDAAIAEAQTIALQRINDVLTPLYNELIASLKSGTFFSTTSATPIPLALGDTAFEIASSDLQQFVPTAFLSAVSASDPTQFMSGQFISLDRVSGQLVIEVGLVSGSGTRSDWLIGPAMPAIIPSVIDPGFYDGSAPTSDPVVPVESTGGIGTF